ncbi:hypothetical protein F5Y05DRAFT_420945 [Hypoxylon sp. FL0543]|nr:hypothetical protein F5Y05DRAFT_420945 [Hypoxylon sp. FL0543]
MDQAPWPVDDVPQHQSMSMSQPLQLSFEQENEVLAKARKKNRLAQRKHRQKMKSLSNVSSDRGQDAPEIAQKESREASMDKDSQSGYDQNDVENFRKYRQVPIDAGSDRGYYAASPKYTSRYPGTAKDIVDDQYGADSSQEPSLQAIDLHSVNHGVWTFSKEMGALMSPGMDSNTSLDSEDKVRRLSGDGGIAGFNSPFFPMDTDGSNASRHSRVGHSEYGYDYDLSQIPFSSCSGPLASDVSQVPVNMLGKGSSYKVGYKGQIRNRHNSVASHVSASPRSSHSNSSRWPSQTVSTSPNTNRDLGNNFSTTPLYVVVPSSNSSSSSAAMLANANPSTSYIYQPTGSICTPPSETSQQSCSEDEVSRFERVLEAIDEAGFDSIDSMAAAYYAAVFPHGSPVHSAQSLSKKRHLRRLLAGLHESAKSWDAQELQNFREGIMRSAEDILIDEIQSLDLNSVKGAGNDNFLGKIESVFLSKEGHEATKENKRVFTQRATETWSLLTELGNSVGLRPAQNAQIVSAFLSMLLKK